MTEIKKQLTELQVTKMLTAQHEYEQMKTQVESLSFRLEEVRNLILDAHGLDGSKIKSMTLNVQTGELTVQLNDEEVK